MSLYSSHEQNSFSRSDNEEKEELHSLKKLSSSSLTEIVT